MTLTSYLLPLRDRSLSPSVLSRPKGPRELGNLSISMPSPSSFFDPPNRLYTKCRLPLLDLGAQNQGFLILTLSSRRSTDSGRPRLHPVLSNYRHVHRRIAKTYEQLKRPCLRAPWARGHCPKRAQSENITRIACKSSRTSSLP